MTDKRTFKLLNFSPIGFKVENYPVQYCSLCRGYLTEICNTCVENKCENCDVIQANESYYHVHCHKLFNGNVPIPKPPVKKTDDDDSGSEH